jgi:hypothetical protein
MTFTSTIRKRDNSISIPADASSAKIDIGKPALGSRQVFIFEYFAYKFFENNILPLINLAMDH